MARERFRRARARLAGAGRPAPRPAAEISEVDPVEPDAAADDAARGGAADAGEVAAEAGEVAAEAVPAEDPLAGYGSVSLGDLGETRREAIARRLRESRARRLPRPRLPARARSGGGSPASARLAGLRSRGGELGTSARVAAAGAAGALSHRWHGLPLLARQRIAAGAVVLALALIVAFILVPAAPCGAPGGEECSPSDDAIGLVPADALAYAHLDISEGSSQRDAAAGLAARVPLLTSLLADPISTIDGTAVDFTTQVAPWAGEEAAIAVLPGRPSPQRVTMIEAEDGGGAREFAASLLGPATTPQEVDGIAVTVGRGNRAAAMLEGFLLLGDLDAVSRLIDPPAGAGRLETAAAAAVLDDLPAERVAYAYLSPEGARALLSGPDLAPLDTFVDSAASAGVAASLGASGDTAQLTIRSSLDPTASASSPAFFSALPPFGPTLAADAGPNALAYLGLGDPAGSIDALLARAAADAPALRAAFDRASESLRRSGGVSIADDLVPLLSSEVALAIEPVAGPGGGAPGTLQPAGVPYVSLLADGVDAESAAASLADLQAPLAEALAPAGGESAGRVSVFEPLQVAGVEAQSLTISPNVELTYATYEDRLAVATDPLGIAQARAGGDGLDDSPAFAEVTEGFPAEVSALAYLDLRDLLSLGEQVGLGADPAYATLAPDLRMLEAAAIAVGADGGGIDTDVRVSLGGPQPAAADTPPLSGD